MAENSKVAIVTGASQGIGKATSITLSANYASLVLVARDEAALRETASRIKEESPNTQCLELPTDLRGKHAPEEVVRRALDRFGKIDAVVNIAGAVPQVNLLDTTDEQWEDGFALKFHGARRLTISAWPALKKSGGSVVFISGNSAELPKAPFAAVATVNAAIVALSKAFADQGYEDGIQVNCILPGPVLTNRRQNYLKKWSSDHGMNIDDAKVHFLKQARIERYGEAAEIASFIAYVLSPAARWMTGTAVRVDGGEVKTI